MLRRALATFGLIGIWIVFGNVSPALAELPPISCRNLNQINWCVAFENRLLASAGIGNPTGTRRVITPFADYIRVELIYYPGPPLRRGERVFAVPEDFYIELEAGEVRRSPRWATFNPGTYCARAYYPLIGFYEDVHCVHSSGYAVPPEVFGQVPPRFITLD